MIGLETKLLQEETSRQRTGLAFLACFISLAFHILLVLWLSRLTWSFVTPRETRRERDRRPFELADVKPVAVPEPDLPVLAKPGDPSLPADLPRQVEELSSAPEEVIIEPPATPEMRLAGELGLLAEPSPAPRRETWEARQEILAVKEAIADDKAALLPRMAIPDLARVENAPDFVLPVDRDAMKPDEMSLSLPEFSAGRIASAKIDAMAGTGGGEGWGRLAREKPAAEPTGQAATNIVPDSLEKPEEETPEEILKAIEKFLVAEMTVYEPLTDMAYGYMKIEIRRTGPDVLPVIPKDVALVLDCSNSMADQRLYFCTNGLIRSLAEIGPSDRFNVILFRDNAEMCFTNWAAYSGESAAEARAFLGGARAGGNTDIYSSLRRLLDLETKPGRPVIVVLVSDGYPTMGVVRSSDIIAEFSRDNAGRLSIFALGTSQTANSYLLDLLSYCNRGDSFVVKSGRWDIPDHIHRLAREVSRPVLSDVRFAFSNRDVLEVYPAQTSNLYLDRPLALFGRYRRGALPAAVFQAVGMAGEIKCDMVFNIPLASARKGDSSIRESWARQKIYHLISEHARRQDPSILAEIRATARAYRIEIPYRGSIGK